MIRALGQDQRGVVLGAVDGPRNVDVTVEIGERAVLGRVGRQLVHGQAEALGRFASLAFLLFDRRLQPIARDAQLLFEPPHVFIGKVPAAGGDEVRLIFLVRDM